jgi:uncharacterized protein involved in exopolysaccharide biosynthesis
VNTVTSKSIEQVSWRDVAAAFRSHRWLALGVLAATLLAATAVAFLMPPVYRSEVLVVPAREDQSQAGLSSVLGKLGGLAGTVGINLPTGGSAAVQQAIDLLESRGFLADFIEKRQLLPVLFAEDWDATGQRWTVARDRVPTLNDGVERIRRKVLKVDDGAGTSIRIIVDWTDREQAAEWANDLVAMLNERARQRALDEAQRSLAYLDAQLADTTTVAVRESIFGMIEESLNRAMLANVRREYVFEVLDPAVPADEDRPLRPRKGPLLVLGLLAGLALAALAVALRAGFTRPAASE